MTLRPSFYIILYDFFLHLKTRQAIKKMESIHYLDFLLKNKFLCSFPTKIKMIWRVLNRAGGNKYLRINFF